MKTMTMDINLECDVMFNEEGALEVYLYTQDVDDPSVFEFKLPYIIKEYVDMFTVPSDPPHIHHDDLKARDSLYNLSNTLKSGAAYVEELQNKYLDNEPNDKDIVE